MNRVLFFILSCPLVAYAEVSDKMATQPELWAQGAVVGCILGVAIRWSKWVNIVGFPIVALFFYLAYDTLAQPDIGPAIIKEQGSSYIVALYGSATLALIGLAIGNYMFRGKCKNA